MSALGQQHLIIGGTIKAATSSLFNYLSAHPQVCGSRIKETFFFSQGYSGDPQRDREAYAAFFAPGADSRLLLEASPNYLAYKENVAPRIKQLLPEARLLFVLRDPAERLYSHFNFAMGKLELPPELAFEDFIELCRRYNDGATTPAQAGIPEKHLRALEIGNYAPYLRNYYEVFDAAQIKVVLYDDFSREPRARLAEIAEFAGIEADFFRDLALARANVTFAARARGLHLAALSVNRSLEPFFRRYPPLKRGLLRIYKLFNRSSRGLPPLSDAARETLNSYYAPSNRMLKDMLQFREPPSWLG